MIERDFLRLMTLGAVELALRRLERGEHSAASSDYPVAEPSLMDIAQRAALLANVGERVLQKHDLRHHEPEVAR